jgi:nucleotide-binding universal stress UspA family protein
MKHKLLVAVDGNESARKAALYAARACADSGPSFPGIVVCHVYVPIPPYVEGANPIAADELAERTEQQRTTDAEKILADIKGLIVGEGIPPELVTTALAERQGLVKNLLVQAAAAHGCDTIVVGHHNRSLLGELLVEGVVEHLLHKPNGYTLWLVA